VFAEGFLSDELNLDEDRTGADSTLFIGMSFSGFEFLFCIKDLTLGDVDLISEQNKDGHGINFKIESSPVTI
jgi:hypothetical protein